LLSRRSGQHNNRRHRRTHRRLQVHRLSPGPRHNRHNSPPAEQPNQVRQCLGRPLNNHLPACRQGRRECLQSVRLALLRWEQLLPEQLLRRH